MPPLLRACVAAAVLAAIAATANKSLEPTRPKLVPGSQDAHAPSPLLRPCPPKTLLDNQVCVPAPELGGSDAPNDSVRNWQVFDRLPRRPERPRDYQRFALPVNTDTIQPSPFSTEDQVSGDALLLGGPQGSTVKLVPLEGQRGAAKLLYTGRLVGLSAVTEHRVTEAGRPQVYLVVYGNLESVSVKAGQQLEAGRELGKTGNSATGHAVGLHLEARRLRHGVDAHQLDPADYLSRAYTVASDARNILVLKR